MFNKISKLLMVAGLAICTSFAPANAEDGEYKFAGKETVLCLKNTTDEDLVVVVGEQFVIDKRLRSRVIQSKPNGTTCLRYDDLQFAWIEFTTKAKVEAGDQISSNDLRYGPTCRRLKGGFAKFYLLGIKDNGRQTCIADKRSKSEIKALVANAKPISG